MLSGGGAGCSLKCVLLSDLYLQIRNLLNKPHEFVCAYFGIRKGYFAATKLI